MEVLHICWSKRSLVQVPWRWRYTFHNKSFLIPLPASSLPGHWHSKDLNKDNMFRISAGRKEAQEPCIAIKLWTSKDTHTERDRKSQKKTEVNRNPLWFIWMRRLPLSIASFKVRPLVAPSARFPARKQTFRIHPPQRKVWVWIPKTMNSGSA
jgi:hypothetical protein